MLRVCMTAGLLATVSFLAGCSSSPKLVQVKGKVTFKGEPVPEGYISFTPEMGTKGEVRLVKIKDGVFDTAKDGGGVHPGACTIRIAGFDGKSQKFWPQGKQIFNPIDLKETISGESWTKDFEIPLSAANNLRIEPTSDD